MGVSISDTPIFINPVCRLLSWLVFDTSLSASTKIMSVAFQYKVWYKELTDYFRRFLDRFKNNVKVSL